jgi:hypothetical protein
VNVDAVPEPWNLKRFEILNLDALLAATPVFREAVSAAGVDPAALLAALAEAMLWPVDLVAPKAGEKLFLIVRSEYPEPGKEYVFTVLPRREENPRRVATEAEAQRILAADLLAQVQAERSARRLVALLNERAPILARGEAEAIAPLLRHPDAEVRRSALAATLYATEDDASALAIGRDLGSFFEQGAGGSCLAHPEAYCEPMSRLPCRAGPDRGKACVVGVGAHESRCSQVSAEQASPSGSVGCWIAVVLLLRLPHLDLRLLVEAVVRHEDDAHAPSGIGDQEPPELAPGELLLVDPDDRLSVGSSVVDLAAQHAAARRPLVARREVPDLRLAGRNLDRDVFVGGRQLLLRPQGVVEEIEDLLVAHLLDLGTDREVSRGDVRFHVFDDGVLGTARDPHLVEPGDARLLHPHGDGLRRFDSGVPDEGG